MQDCERPTSTGSASREPAAALVGSGALCPLSYDAGAANRPARGVADVRERR